MFIGAIADDLTGATDLSLMLRDGGMKVLQLVGMPTAPIATGDADAVVVALKSRTSPVEDAVAQSVASAKSLMAAGAQQLFFKYCSTFDSTDKGNIGPVIDALMTLLGESKALACPAFPANGRRVYRGHLFVGDELLSDSSMRNHPLTPMRDSNLVRVLQRQTGRKVTLVAHETVGDPEALQSAIADLRGIAILDAICDADLRRIGHAARDVRLISGGSGMALGLPDNFPLHHKDHSRSFGPIRRGRSVVLAGSCSAATRAQIEAAIAAGMPALSIDPGGIAEGSITPDQAIEFVLSANADLPPLIYSSAAPSAVAEAQQKLGPEVAGDLVEQFLATTARELRNRGINRFLVAGGETSGAVVQGLGVSALEIGPRIDAGVPWTRTQDGSVALALKSGNFGSTDIFVRAWDLLS